ncbi:MAG: hypothetical protein AAF829_05525 [Pseudomonadota bacterium]
MQFKRSGLVPGRSFVNASLGAFMLFLAGCGNGAGETPPQPNAPAGLAANPGKSEGFSLPAVWSSRTLDRSVRDLALAGGAASAIAVAYEGGGLQFFNLDGEFTTEIAELNVAEVSAGTYLEFGDAGLVLFPGIDQDRQLTAYIHSVSLDAPVEVALPIETTGPIEAVCSRTLGSTDVGDLELAFWTPDDTIARQGTLGTDGDAFTFNAVQGTTIPEGATGCALTRQGLVFNVSGTHVAALDRKDALRLVFLIPTGRLTLADHGSDAIPLSIRDGISVKMPSQIAAMDALGDPRAGGYPGGVIVVGGLTSSGHQLVFVDTAQLTANTPSMP